MDPDIDELPGGLAVLLTVNERRRGPRTGRSTTGAGVGMAEAEEDREDERDSTDCPLAVGSAAAVFSGLRPKSTRGLGIGRLGCWPIEEERGIDVVARRRGGGAPWVIVLVELGDRVRGFFDQKF